jgi:hypothetical protein
MLIVFLHQRGIGEPEEVFSTILKDLQDGVLDFEGLL